MPRGGRRTGTPGKKYPNRADLHDPARLPATAPTGQPYGVRAQQIAAQTQIPMGASHAPAVVPQGPQVKGVREAAGPFGRPTDRPDEPITYGLTAGPGPGPEVLGPAFTGQPAEDPAISRLRGIYRAFPSEALRELLEEVDSV